MRPTSNLPNYLADEYVKRARAQAALVSTSWHNDMLTLSESIVVKHAAELSERRRQLAMNSNYGQDDARWLQDVESFIDEMIEPSGPHVKNSPALLRAVRWMIGSATTQFATPQMPCAVADAA